MEDFAPTVMSVPSISQGTGNVGGDLEEEGMRNR